MENPGAPRRIPSPKRRTDLLAELSPLPRKRRRPMPVILDTDMNEDVDDAGALSVPHARAFWDIEVETRKVRRIPAAVPVPNPRWT